MPAALALVALFAAAGAAAQDQRGERVFESPTLPEQPPSAASAAVPASAVVALAPDQAVVSADGQTAGRIVEVVRTPDGRINRVLIDASDGQRRSVPGAAIRFESGQARLSIPLAEALALPEVKP